ncbi:MAG: protein kinase domain-containing protein [Mariniblastus sp.]
MIHRDLKPENILFDAQHDVVVLADFGFATIIEQGNRCLC